MNRFATMRGVEQRVIMYSIVSRHTTHAAIPTADVWTSVDEAKIWCEETGVEKSHMSDFCVHGKVCLSREPQRVCSRVVLLSRLTPRRCGSSIMSSSSNAKELAPRVPVARSLMHFQDLLSRGMWSQRHLEALANDPKTVDALVAIIECGREHARLHNEAVDAKSHNKVRQADTRNKICMCLAVCNDETAAWLGCVRGEIKQHKGDREAGYAAQRINCEGSRRALEKCTQWESQRLLHAAVVPQPTDPCWANGLRAQGSATA